MNGTSSDCLFKEPYYIRVTVPRLPWEWEPSGAGGWGDDGQGKTLLWVQQPIFKWLTRPPLGWRLAKERGCPPRISSSASLPGQTSAACPPWSAVQQTRPPEVGEERDENESLSQPAQLSPEKTMSALQGTSQSWQALLTFSVVFWYWESKGECGFGPPARLVTV